MFLVIPLPDPKRTVRFCAFIISAMIFCLPPLLTGQDMIHSFRDDLPKRHSALTAVAADDNHFYIAGRSSAQCSPRSFVACLNKDGAEIWNTLDMDVNLGRVDRVHPENGYLFVASSFLDIVDVQTRNRAGLFKIDPATGAIVWSQIVGNDGDVNRAVQIFPFNEETIIYLTRSTDILTNRLWFHDVQSGALRHSVDLSDRWRITGLNIAADGQGGLYYLHTLGIIKLDGSSTDPGEVLWEVSTSDVNLNGILDDVIVTANDRLYCLTQMGQVVELDRQSGELINQFSFSNLDEVVYTTSKLVDGDKLYLAWRTAARPGDSLNASRLDLNLGRLDWRSRAGFSAQSVFSNSLILSDENTLLLSGDLYDYDPDHQAMGIARLDAASGAIESQYPIQTTHNLLRAMLAKSGSDIRLFNNHVEDVAFSVFSHIESRRLDVEGTAERDVRTYTGRAVFPSSVLQMINTGDQLIQLRQVGTSVAVVWLDSELNIEHSTLLPRSNNIACGVRMAVNALGQVAVIVGLKWWNESGGDTYAPGYRQGPVSGAYDIHLLRSSGEILQSHFEQGEFGGYWLPDIVSDKVNFYMARKNINNVQIIQLGVAGLLSRTLPVTAMGGQLYNRSFIAQGDRVFFAAAVKDQRGQLWEINTVDFNLDPLLDWPDCDEVATTALNGNRATVACKFQGSAEIIHIDLETAEILWRQRLDNDSQVRYLLTHNQKIFTVGDKLNAESDCLDFSLGRIDVNSGEFDWIKLRPCPGDAYPQVFFADINDDEIAVGGRQHHTPLDGRAHFFVMRLDLEGRERDFHVIDYPEADPAPIGEFDPGPVAYSPDGSLLYSVQERFADDCYLSAAVYRLDPATSAEDEHLDISERLTIVPNPVERASRLVFNGVAGTEYSIEVRDLLGRIVINRRIALEYPSSGVPLALDHLSRGTFTVSVNGAGRHWQAVLVKQ